MNTIKIQKLTEQVNSLNTFHLRCLWTDTILSCSGYSLSGETSALIKREIHEIVDRQIEMLEVEIKKEVENG